MLLLCAIGHLNMLLQHRSPNLERRLEGLYSADISVSNKLDVMHVESEVRNIEYQRSVLIVVAIALSVTNLATLAYFW